MERITIYVLVSVLVGLLVGAGVGWLSKPAVEVPVTVTAPGVTVTETVAGPTVTTTVTPEVPVGLTGEVKIGWTDGLTGANAFWGEQALTAAKIALEEVNQHLDETGAGWRMDLVVEDSETKPEVALDKLKSLHARGITIVSGWGTSADLKACMTYADANKILLLSYGSNAMDLAIEGDYAYRLLPTVVWEGKAVADISVEEGIKYLIPVWRGDAWGDSEVEGLRLACLEAGIEVDAGIRYPPDAIEFTSEAAVFNSKVLDAVSKYGADKVGWYICCFEEGKAFYEAIAVYDPLAWGIKWVTSEGPCLTDWVVETPIIAGIVSKADCTSPITTPTASGKLIEIQEKIEARLGRKADIYGLNAYDSIWILALALFAADEYDADAVRAQLPMVFESYHGVAGWAPLDKYGDRAGRNYGLYRVMEIEGVYKWVRVGEWDFGTRVISWLPRPEIVG